MKKKIRAIMCSAALILCMVVTMMPAKAEAATSGTNAKNAISMQMGQEYTKKWTVENYTNSEKIYNKFTINKAGMVTIKATKPKDSQGKNAIITFSIRDKNDKSVWANRVESQQNNGKTYYEVAVGLDAGTYYMVMDPECYPGSGKSTTIKYSMKHQAGEFYERENNDSVANANEMKPSEWYYGLYGNDKCYSGGEEADYWKMYMTAGVTYRVWCGNYKFINNTTAILEIKDPSGNNVPNWFNMSSQVDEDGDNYIEFTAPATGYYTADVYNYNGSQQPYALQYASVYYSSYGDNYTGLRDGGDANWYLYYNGTVNQNYTGLYYDPVYGWWYVVNGKVRFDYTGLVCDPNVGWWYVQNGAINFGYNGLVPNEYGWWCVQNGTINFNYNGLVQNEFGWWCVQNGAINFNYNGLMYDPYVGWWVVSNGAINFGYTGMIANEYGWWFAVNGALDFNATGWACNEYGWWLYYNGTIAFNYTGWWDGYYCINGHLA